MIRHLRLLSRLRPRAVKATNSLVSGIEDLRSHLTVGQAIGSAVGILAVLLLAWWTVGIGTYQKSATPWQFVAVLILGTLIGGVVVFVPRERYFQLFVRHFGWIPVTVGVLTYPYWLWYTGGTDSVDIGFFETAAQVLPVILLAAIVDIRQSPILKSNQLTLPVIAIFLGETAALNEAAFHYYASVQGTVAADYAVVSSSLVTAIAALGLAVLADFKQASRNQEESSSSHELSDDAHEQGRSRSRQGVPRQRNL